MLLLGLLLDLVEQFDPRQRLVRPRRVAGPRLVELPPRVHHAADLDDLARGEQGVVGRIRIGLEIALEALEDRRRARATAVRRVSINDVGMVVITEVDPEPAGLDPLAVVVLHWSPSCRRSGSPWTRGPAMHGVDDRLQQVGGDGHPVAHRLTGSSSTPWRRKMPSWR